MLDVETGLTLLGLTKYIHNPARGSSVPSVTVTLFPCALEGVGASPICCISAVVEQVKLASYYTVHYIIHTPATGVGAS